MAAFVSDVQHPRLNKFEVVQLLRQHSNLSLADCVEEYNSALERSVLNDLQLAVTAEQYSTLCKARQIWHDIVKSKSPEQMLVIQRWLYSLKP